MTLTLSQSPESIGGSSCTREGGHYWNDERTLEELLVGCGRALLPWKNETHPNEDPSAINPNWDRPNQPR